MFGRNMLTTPPTLLDRLRNAPDRDAWDKFVTMYTPLFFSWTKRLGMNGHESADFVQDLFVILVEQLPRFRYDPNRSFRAWLKAIAMNRWRSRLRQKKIDAAEAAELEHEADSASDFGEAEYRQYLVVRALGIMQAEFEPETWKACWEFVVSGRPAAEVAAELHISVNAVYLSKSRVLRRLRQELAGLLE